MVNSLYADVLATRTGDESLDGFLSVLKSFIECTEWSKRSSSNYIDEEYFICKTTDWEVRLSTADSDEFQGFNFWIEFKNLNTAKDDLSVICDRLARDLAFTGRITLRPFRMRRLGQGAMLYRVGLDGQIVTENI